MLDTAEAFGKAAVGTVAGSAGELAGFAGAVAETGEAVRIVADSAAVAKVGVIEVEAAVPFAAWVGLASQGVAAEPVGEKELEPAAAGGSEG